MVKVTRSFKFLIKSQLRCNSKGGTSVLRACFVTELRSSGGSSTVGLSSHLHHLSGFHSSDCFDLLFPFHTSCHLVHDFQFKTETSSISQAAMQSPGLRRCHDCSIRPATGSFGFKLSLILVLVLKLAHSALGLFLSQIAMLSQ